MKTKLIIATILVWVFCVVSLTFAAGSCTQSATQDAAGKFVIVKFVCTGDAANGSIPNTAVSSSIMALVKYKYSLVTVTAYPTSGGTAPDAADVFILDANSRDLLGSLDGSTTANAGANLIHPTLTKSAMPFNPVVGEAYNAPVTNDLTLKVSNQSTVSANYTVELVFVR